MMVNDGVIFIIYWKEEYHVIGKIRLTSIELLKL